MNQNKIGYIFAMYQTELSCSTIANVLAMASTPYNYRVLRIR